MEKVISTKKSTYFDTLDWGKIKTPCFWYENEPIVTHFFNAISIAIPETERFLVNSMKPFRTYGFDTPLLKQIHAFCEDENSHSLNHTRFNRDLKRHKYPIHFGLKFSRLGFKLINYFSSNKTRLAITVALEHMTAVLAIYGFDYNVMIKTISDPEKIPDIYYLFTWHSYEELSHRSVAFDVYQAIGGGYFRRILAAMYATLTFLTGVISIMISLILSDICKRRKIKLRHWMYATKFFFGRKGLLWGCFKNYFSIYKFKFNPDHLHLNIDYYFEET